MICFEYPERLFGSLQDSPVNFNTESRTQNIWKEFNPFPKLFFYTPWN